MKLTIDATAVLACANFAVQVTQSQRQFGSAAKRTQEQMILDTFEGKLGEVGFTLACQRYGPRLHLDFAQYADGVTDNGTDITTMEWSGTTRLPTIRVDVKAIGDHSRWLLVEAHKFTADVYVIVRHGQSRDALRQMLFVDRRITDCVVEVVGFAPRSRFYAPDNTPWAQFAQGERLRAIPQWFDEMPDAPFAIRQFRSEWSTFREIGPTLDAPKNYGLPTAWLRTDWETLLERMWETALVEELTDGR